MVKNSVKRYSDKRYSVKKSPFYTSLSLLTSCLPEQVTTVSSIFQSFFIYVQAKTSRYFKELGLS